MSEDRLQQFFDYKEIIELKARFGRLVDVKDWEAYADVFTEDCEFDFGDGRIMVGGRTYSYAVRDMLEGAVSVHRACMPEIEFVSRTEAKGIWAVNGYIEWSPDHDTGERAGQMLRPGVRNVQESRRQVEDRALAATLRPS
jgi:hypothetical protein